MRIACLRRGFSCFLLATLLAAACSESPTSPVCKGCACAGCKPDARPHVPDAGSPDVGAGRIGSACLTTGDPSTMCPGGTNARCEPTDECGHGFCSQACDTAACPAGSTCAALPWVDPVTIAYGAARRCLLPCAGGSCPAGEYCDSSATPAGGACVSEQMTSAIGTIGGRKADGSACVTPAPAPTAAPRLLGTNVEAGDPSTSGGNEPAAAIAADGTLYVADNDDDKGIGVGVSKDGGATWSFSAPPDPGAIGDPGLAVDPTTGRVYFSYIVFLKGFSCTGGAAYPGETAIHVAYTADRGASWSAPVAASDPSFTSDKYLTDKPWIVVDGSGAIHVSYAVFATDLSGGTQAEVATSTDGGKTFTSAPFAPGGFHNLIQEAVDGAGALYLAWYGNGIDFCKSTDGGKTFTAPVPVTADPTVAYEVPVVTVSPDGGRLFVTYTHDDGGGATDVMLATSDDGGATWGTPVAVDDDAPCASHAQPWNALDEKGNLYVLWYDNRYGDQRVVAREGTVTGGAGMPIAVTFGALDQVTDAATPYTDSRGALFHGDYLALAIAPTSGGERALAAWGDLRLALAAAKAGDTSVKAARIFAATGSLP